MVSVVELSLSSQNYYHEFRLRIHTKNASLETAFANTSLFYDALPRKEKFPIVIKQWRYDIAKFNIPLQPRFQGPLSSPWERRDEDRGPWEQSLPLLTLLFPKISTLEITECTAGRGFSQQPIYARKSRVDLSLDYPGREKKALLSCRTPGEFLNK